MADATAPRREFPLLRWLENWPVGQKIVGGALAAALISTAFFSPRFWLWRALGVPLGNLISIQPELNRAFFALRQLQDPWQRIDNPINRVIEWRLFWPVLAHYSGMPEAIYFALPHLGCLLVLVAIAGIAWRRTGDGLATSCIALLAATSSWFFVSVAWLGYFDSWLMLGLLAVAFAPSRWLIFGAALISPWIDERFILAAPISLAVRAACSGSESDMRKAWRKDWPAVAVGLAPYAAVRLAAELGGWRATSHDYWSHRPLLPASPWVLAWGAWNGLRLGWLPLLWFLHRAIRSRRGLAAAIILTALAISLTVADDLSRSVSVALPAVLGGILLAWQSEPGRARRALPLLCLGNLLLPAEHVIASPANSVEAYHCVPILGLYAEMARASDPPYFASAAAYDRRGMDAFVAGRSGEAMANFGLALRFDPDFQRAHADRGIARFAAGDREGGMQELDRALALAPWLYEARMQRATFRQQSGNASGALQDVEAALRDMPADWPRRADAERFRNLLTTQRSPSR